MGMATDYLEEQEIFFFILPNDLLNSLNLLKCKLKPPYTNKSYVVVFKQKKINKTFKAKNE